ncbi:hypothetical protein GQ53DRAFT_669656, partial [Thozetella sp. PMI_491]
MASSNQASQPRDTFGKAVERFRNQLSEEQRVQFATTSLKDVKLEIQRVQDHYGPEKRLRNMRRLSKFLEVMSQIEQVVSVFLNVSEVVAFVWGPIKFGLVVASARLETLEGLLDTYVEIGEVIPGLKQYDSIFNSCPAVTEVLELYFCDILQFHTNALEVFTRPAWKDFFHSSWKTFRSKFGPILESLKRHRALLLDERMTAAITEIQTTRQVTTERVQNLAAASDTNFKNLSSKMESSIEEKLNPPDYKADYYSAEKQRFSGSGDGMLKNELFLEWSHGHDRTKNILYLHGKPGAGKSIMVSRIIDHLVAETASPVLFFYFRYGNDTKTSMAGLLRALLVQLLYQDDSLTEWFHQKFASISQSDLCSLARLQDLFIEAAKSQKSFFVILDGLDECEQDDPKSKGVSKAIIDWLDEQVIPACRAEGGYLRLLLSGQRDGILDRRLSEVPAIGLDTTYSHKEDIRRFAKERALEIGRRFSLSIEKQTSIVNKVADAADGMFLYAKVVLENLLEQGSEADLEDELDESFPAGLDEAYQRVVVRVLDRPPPRQRDAAAKILCWIVCAVRPLYWREIQSLFCINAEDGTCDAKRRRVDTCKVICGSLVEAEPCSFDPKAGAESRIKLVHVTAGNFLVRSGRINLLQEHTNMALFCCHYLASRPFDATVPAEEVISIAETGYYGAQDYATAFWCYHIKALLDTPTAGRRELTDSLVTAVAAVFSKFRIPYQKEDDTDENPLPITVLQAVLDKLHGNTLVAQALEERTVFIRTVIETMNISELDSKQRATFSLLQGVPRFKCTKLSCHHFAFGFRIKKDRDNHVAEHELPFKCLVESCYARTIGFPTYLTLETHVRKQHSLLSSKAALFPNSKDLKRADNIWAACAAGDLEAAKRHIAHTVDMDIAQFNGRSGLSPIVIAARNGHLNVCRLLVEHGASVLY